MIEEKFCRVCRCEGTSDHPLFHPCKCRGSIKYIHQDCLQFWLQHSNKDTCDICHTKFNFKIIYNEGTPDSIPWKLIVKQFFKDLVRYQYYLVKFSLMFVCIVYEAPFIIALINKLIDFQLGVPIKIESPYLSNIFESYKPYEDGSLNMLSFFETVIIPGFEIGLVYALILISMIIIQNSFVGDEGFQKIVDKKIGRQRYKLLDLLQQNRRRTILRALYEQDNVQKIERELESIGWTEDHVYELGEILLMINTCRRIALELILLPAYREKYEGMQHFIDELHPEEITNEQVDQLAKYYKIMRIDHLNKGYEDQERRLFDNIERLDEQGTIRPDQINELADNLARLPDEIVAEEIVDAPARPAPVPQPAPAAARPPRRNAANINVDDDIDQVQGMWDGPKNITFIFQLTLLVNLISMLVLVCFKFIPSFQGLIFLGAFNAMVVSPLEKLFVIAHPYIFPYYQKVISSQISQTISTKYQDSIVPKLIVAFFQRNIIIPVQEAYINSIEWKPTSSVFERVLVVLTGFAVNGLIIYACMKKMERSCTPNNPLTGAYRSAYIIMLQIASVVKVFTLIAIEWVLFPLFCGSQIEFALVPIFNQDLYNYKLDPPLLGTDIFSLVPKWFLGTFFMYFFASYVSMIRSRILRNGVLFFIRPSDDPNLQLIHDALMRPFSLRLSRIALSAAVYSLYIHVEFSLVSWSIRLFFPIEVLPFQNQVFYERIAFASLFILGGFLENTFCKFWKNVFYFSCSKLRLSSFLLNKDNSDERGKVIYKSFFSRFTNSKPDHTDPQLESETAAYFESHPEAECCFVPDGNYVRAPNDDHVSRNFVRTLFVPVTKSDQLLAPIPEYPNDDEKYNPYGDVDPMDVTTYTIVYRPPHFRWRLFALFAVLWFASLAFTFGIYLCNIGIGKSFIRLIGFDVYLGVSSEIYKVDVYALLFTILALSQLEIVSKSIEEQWNALQVAVNSDSGKLNAIKLVAINSFNKLKLQHRRILESAVVKMVFKEMRKQFIITVALGLCGHPILGSLNKEGVCPFWSIPYFLSFVTLVISLSDSNSSKLKIFLFTAIFLVGIKAILTCTVLEYVVKLPHTIVDETHPEGFTYYTIKSTSDYIMISGFIERFLPTPLQPLSPLFIVDNFVGIEAIAYHVIWDISSTYVAFLYVSTAWKKFMDKTKQTYFDNTKILSNADDDEEEDAGEAMEAPAAGTEEVNDLDDDDNDDDEEDEDYTNGVDDDENDEDDDEDEDETDMDDNISDVE